MQISFQKVSAHAGTRLSNSWVAHAKTTEDCMKALAFAREKNLTVLARGRGYSYADMILNDQNLILNTTQMNKILSWDPSTGIIRVEPGVSFADVFKVALPHLWTLASCPGGMGVTIGGAISNNVHGKDSKLLGNFGAQVRSIRLLTANGKLIETSENQYPELFRGVVGGMGLLGVIQDATLQLTKVKSGFVQQKVVPTRGLDETLNLLEIAAEQSDFSVAWVDAFARGSKLGRGFVTTATWQEDQIAPTIEEMQRSLTVPTRVFGLFPASITWKLLSPLFMPMALRWVNAINYWRARITGEKTSRLLFTDYNFMHNKIPGIEKVYAPYGFLEFQPIIPRKNGRKGVRKIFELCQKFHSESLLCGVKLHSGDDFLLTYGCDGFSVGIDIQIRGRSRTTISQFSDELFQLVTSLGGQIYLAKDEMLTRKYFDQMFKAEAFRELKEKWDPTGFFQSDLCRRLELYKMPSLQGHLETETHP